MNKERLKQMIILGVILLISTFLLVFLVLRASPKDFSKLYASQKECEEKSQKGCEFWVSEGSKTFGWRAKK